MQQLFDENGLLNIADIITTHPSYKTIMEDGVVTDQELTVQANRTIASLKRLQTICNDEQQSAILDAISDLSVLYAVHRNYELQNFKF